MTPEQKEQFRWQFAGRCLIAILNDKPRPGQVNNMLNLSVKLAGDLIAELERTAPNEADKTCAENIRLYKQNQQLREDQKQCIEYCLSHADKMWAASLLAIILKCDFRDAAARARRALRGD